jgi:hypothetical protein
LQLPDGLVQLELRGIAALFRALDVLANRLWIGVCWSHGRTVAQHDPKA